MDFSENVTVTGVPRLKVRLADGEDRWASYDSFASSGTSVAFTYKVVGAAAGMDADSGDNSDGVAVVENSLERDRGTIRSTASGNPVSLAHAGLAANPEHKVDTTPPTLVEVVLKVIPFWYHSDNW